MNNKKDTDAGIAILGLGYMGLHHLRILNQISLDGTFNGMAIKSVCDIDKEHAEAVAQKYGIEYSTDKADQAIERDNVTAVFVATPPSQHYPQVDRALQLGKAVYCEKPVGHTLEETEKLAEKARNLQVLNQVGLVLRNSPPIQYIKKLILSKELGEVTACQLHSRSRAPDGGIFRASFKDRMKGNSRGILYEENIHDIDTLMYLLGDFTPEDVELTSDSSIGPVDTATKAHLNFSGLPVKYSSKWFNTPAESKRELQIQFEKGVVTGKYFFSGELKITTEEGTRIKNEEELAKSYFHENSIELPNKAYKQWYSYLADYSFLKSFAHQTPCTPTLKDAAFLEKKIHGMYNCARWKK